MAEKTSQAIFADKLGFSSKDMYRHHMLQFTAKIRYIIKEEYGVDITDDVISYLRNEIRQLEKENEALKKSLKEEKNSGSKPEKSAGDIISNF